MKRKVCKKSKLTNIEYSEDQTHFRNEILPHADCNNWQYVQIKEDIEFSLKYTLLSYLSKTFSFIFPQGVSVSLLLEFLVFLWLFMMWDKLSNYRSWTHFYVEKRLKSILSGLLSTFIIVYKRFVSETNIRFTPSDEGLKRVYLSHQKACPINSLNNLYWWYFIISKLCRWLIFH